jgi:hypothetical protein
MTSNNNNTPDTKAPVTNTPSPDATTNNKAGQQLPGSTPATDKREAPTTDDRKDGKNNAPGSVPDPARTTANTGSDTKTPQGSAT